VAKNSVKRNDYVEIASYLFFEEYKKERRGEVPGVIYNKFITLLNRELKPEKDIGLPHYWYRWGDIVVAHCVPYTSWEHVTPRYTVVRWAGDIPNYDPNDKIVSLIRKNIAEFMVRHSGSEAHETAKDEVYEGAPFKFQNEYRKLRESLESLSKRSIMDNKWTYIDSLFNNAMDEFPKKEFKHIVNEKDKFEAVFRMGLKNKASEEDLFDLAELFWFFFCYHLRMNKKGHENVPKETLNIWVEEIPWETMKIEHILQNYAYRFCIQMPGDKVITLLLEDRKKRMDKIDALMPVICEDRPGGIRG